MINMTVAVARTVSHTTRSAPLQFLRTPTLNTRVNGSEAANSVAVANQYVPNTMRRARDRGTAIQAS